ncbi:hypothetical protein EYF80_013781 [Liparis tanakae]|uniref:Uncharacterized protein n=1 Tax=Liparis tanakae TaxID=230148 RepID=A0A4Z2IDE4_9TELE|nr:hypothetical protein EYF80_013781 [Liparis tanakae]
MKVNSKKLAVLKHSEFQWQTWHGYTQTLPNPVYGTELRGLVCPARRCEQVVPRSQVPKSEISPPHAAAPEVQPENSPLCRGGTEESCCLFEIFMQRQP